MKAKLSAITLSICCLSVNAGVQEGIAAMRNGDYQAAYKEFLPLAKKGDDKAMITIGLMYHQGQGFKQDYSKAMDWYIKALKKNNGDAWSNIGVMFRDGLGVKKNKKIAYCMFLITHVCGLGSQSTQYRANSCLRRMIPQMTLPELKECFNYTVEYIRAYAESRGTLKGIPDQYKPSPKRAALKDKPWWVKGELDFLKEDTPKAVAKKEPAKYKSNVKLEFRTGSMSAEKGLTQMKVKGSSQPVYISNEVILSNRDVASASILLREGSPIIKLNLTGSGKEKFATASANNINKPVGVFIDGQLICAPIVKDKVSGGQVCITGDFTKTDAQHIVNGLNKKQ